MDGRCSSMSAPIVIAWTCAAAFNRVSGLDIRGRPPGPFCRFGSQAGFSRPDAPDGASQMLNELYAIVKRRLAAAKDVGACAAGGLMLTASLNLPLKNANED